MASILNAGRGIRAKEQINMILVTDEEYASYLDSVRSLPKKEQKKWKRQNEKTDGSTSTIRFDGQGFYAQWLNSRVEVKSQSMIASLTKEHDAHKGHISKVQIEDFQDTQAVHSAIDQMLVDTHTGKHTSRNHPIAVPTKPGQPVRG